MDSPSCTQGIAAGPAAMRAPAIEGFKPPGRKKFISAELTHGPSAPDPQGRAPPPTVNGLAGVCPAASAALKLATIKSPRIVLALMGRFRGPPPLKLYARLRANPSPRSRSTVTLACCEYA